MRIPCFCPLDASKSGRKGKDCNILRPGREFDNGLMQAVGHGLELFFTMFDDEGGGEDEIEYVGLISKLIYAVVGDIGRGQGCRKRRGGGRRSESFPAPSLDAQPLEEIVVRRSDKRVIEGHAVVAGSVVLRGASLKWGDWVAERRTKGEIVQCRHLSLIGVCGF